ncbi:hypothetical protein KR009_001854, partial [Drosophila setifemur]
ISPAAPYQELEPRKGHVPVYIRHGDEPLNEIHLGLAEAFKEGPDLVNEVPQAETTIGTNSEPTTTPAPASSSTESDIASFEAIKAMME